MSPKATTPPPANPFSAKKRNSAGGNLRKKAKGAAGEARPAPLDRRRGSELVFCAKMGSSEFVKSDQFGKIPGIVARMGDFFFGSAQRIPKGFLGGVRFGAPASWRTFLFLCRL